VILSELRIYLADRKRAPLADMASRFDTDPDALRGMLAVLERKGRVPRLSSGAGCSGGCCKCDLASAEVFEWVDREGG
jgi:putative ferrous iron transport protein C